MKISLRDGSCVGRVFTFGAVNCTAADWFRRKTVVEIFSQEKLARSWIAHEDRLFVVSLSVLQSVTQVSVTRRSLFCERAAKTVDEVVCVNRIAVGPTAIVAQVKCEFGGVVVYVPVFGESRVGSKCLGIVLNQAF